MCQAYCEYNYSWYAHMPEGKEEEEKEVEKRAETQIQSKCKMIIEIRTLGNNAPRRAIRDTIRCGKDRKRK